MTGYMLRRFALMLLTLFGMSILIFVVMRLVPGNIADILVDSAGIIDPKQKLKIEREWWLDEDGRGLTFRDAITGQMQQVWRLDAAPGQELGSVRSVGQGQLITRNPAVDAPGVEIRARDINLEATVGVAAAPRVCPPFV